VFSNVFIEVQKHFVFFKFQNMFLQLWVGCSVFDGVERRVCAVRSDAGDDSAVHRVVRQLVQHALRIAERTCAVVDVAPQRQQRLHALPPTDLPPGRHPARQRQPLVENLLRLRRQRRYAVKFAFSTGRVK